jgi:hypothetical protein
LSLDKAKLGCFVAARLAMTKKRSNSGKIIAAKGVTMAKAG